MTAGFAPGAVAPAASLWPATTASVASGYYLAEARANEPEVWLALIQAPISTLSSWPPPWGMPGGLPGATLSFPPVATAEPGPIRVSDRGWIGEPSDGEEGNLAWPARLTEAPAIESAVPIYWDAPRRAEINGGELILGNGDGGLDTLASDWRLTGRSVVLMRGPHRRPQHAPLRAFTRVAEMRAAGVFEGTGILRLALTNVGADLAVAACDTYGGAGDLDGHAGLAGTAKPRLYGLRRNFQPVLIDPARQIWQFCHPGDALIFSAARDRGAPYALAAYHGSYASIRGATVAPGDVHVCLSAGCIRLGSVPSLLTVDAVGVGFDPWGIFTALLTGPGGLSPDRIADHRLDWPGMQAGLLLRGGTVADALDQLAGQLMGFWGADTMGRYRLARVPIPEEVGPSIILEPWMLATPPEEVPGARAPVWRVRVGYRARDVVQTGEDLASSVSGADRDIYGRAADPSWADDDAILRAYPAAIDGPDIVSPYDDNLTAFAQALYGLGLWGRPRRSWRVTVQGPWVSWSPGDAVLVRWPGINALSGGRTMLIRSISGRGPRAELVLWG